jgi:hypothetical protein
MGTYRKWVWRGWVPREAKMEQETPNQKESTPTPKVETRGKWKRRIKTKFRVPEKPALPVKALWESATPEEQKKAHQMAAVILEHWMGQISQTEAAEKLGMPWVRIWQLSRQALSGLTAGLLKQPKMRKGKKSAPPIDPAEDPEVLKKRIAELEKDLGMMKELVGLLKEFPAHREGKQKAEGDGKSGKKKKPEVSPGTDAKDGKVVGGDGAKLPPASAGPTTGS